MLNKGDKVAHYTIESLLGSGGMGAVYLAVDGRLHRRVALKVILDSDRPEDAKESAARLLREARAAASLTHPNVVSVFDVGEMDGRVYLAMEYVVGKTLRDLMRDERHPWQRRLRWLIDVARALGAAHRDGLVHRDIKPENVMVREDGLVKVLDFGIARRATAPVDPTGRTEQAHVATLTGKGLVIGTPMYMAPEQLKGGAPDPRTDQFSWGVMTYEVLAGERPWPEKSDLLAAVATILTEDPTSLRKLAPELPPAVEATVARTLARNADQRFESMDDVADLLDPLAVRSGSSHSARATQRSGISPPDFDEPRRSTPALEEKKGSTTRQAMVTAKSPEHPLAPKPQKRQRRRWPFLAGVVATALLSSGAYIKYFRKPVVIVPIVASVTPSALTSSSEAISDNPAAVIAYQEGLQQWRDGSLRRSRTSLEHATSLDTGLAAAHLLLAVQLLAEEPSIANDRYQKAYLHRTRLDPRDAEVLSVVEPLARASANLGEAESRITKGAKKFPKDPLFQFLLGSVRYARSEYERARDAYEDTIGLDPAFMPAWQAKGDTLRRLGNVDLALAAYGKCIATSPAAAGCLEQRIMLERDRGDCEAMEQDARAWQNVEPESADASYNVAAALMARGAPIQSVEAALRRQWAALPADERALNQGEDGANLAIFSGDFTAAEHATEDWEKAIVNQELRLHVGPEKQLAFIAFETGDVAKAGRIADGFLKIMPAFTPDPLGGDPTMWASEFLFRTGKLTKVELDQKRKDWLKSQEAHRTQQENMRLAPFRWAVLYAGFSESMEEAKEALDKLPDFLPLPPDSRRSSVFDAEMGKAYALAGKNSEAIPALRSVTNACIALGSPLLQTRAFYFLGVALENSGDLQGAKAAYETVVSRWGAAKPKSVTAEKAKARLKAQPGAQ